MSEQDPQFKGDRALVALAQATEIPADKKIAAYLGTLGTIAGAATGLVGAKTLVNEHDLIKAGVEIAAGAGIIVYSTNRLKMRERLGSLIKLYADGASTTLLAIGTIILPFWISQLNESMGRIPLETGVALTVGSFVAGKIIHKTSHNTPPTN
jgi:hypothetical protein